MQDMRRILVVMLLFAASASGQAAASDASRIVAIGGDVTEILYELGAEDRIVAVDTTSLHPPSALADKPNVGYIRQLSSEGVLSLAPTLVLANEKAGPPGVMTALMGSSARVVLVPDRHSFEGIYEKIRVVAAAVGAISKGETLVRNIETAFGAIAGQHQRIARPARALFVLSAEGGRMLVGGRDTAADAMFGLAGIENAAAGLSGFKPIGQEALIALAPDIVFVMRRSRPGAPGGDASTLASLREVPAGASNRVVEVDGLLMLGFGPRTPEAVKFLIAAAYAEAGRVSGR